MEKLLTSAEAAERLRIRPQTLAMWREKRRGPRYLKLGRIVRYNPGDIDAWIAAQNPEAEAQENGGGKDAA